MSAFEVSRLRAGIVNALEALQDGDPGYAVAILRTLDDGPEVRNAVTYFVACPHCSLTFPWPGLRDHHLLMSHDEELPDELEQAA